MNAIFPIILVVSAVALLIFSPDSFLSSLTSGAAQGVQLSLTLASIYLVWCGLFEILDYTGLSDKLAKVLKKPVSFVFGKTDEESEKYITLNVAANLLGLGGIATPLGIEAAFSLEKSNRRFAITMLLVVASTSLQILPTSVISLRLSAGSSDPSSIIFAAFLSTLVSSASGIILTKIFVKR